MLMVKTTLKGKKDIEGKEGKQKTRLGCKYSISTVTIISLSTVKSTTYLLVIETCKR